MALEILKHRFLASHNGYFFGPGDMPINSAGKPDYDAFLIFIICQGTDLIDYYTIYDMVQHVPLEMKSLYAKRIGAIENTINVKPKHPKLNMPQGNCSIEERFQNAIGYYNKCEENVRECNKVVLDAIDKLLIAEEAKDPNQRLLDRICAEIQKDLTYEEIEAVLVYIALAEAEGRAQGFRKNTLLALKVLNRFAKENEIRFEDAITVFKEYLN